MANTYFRFKQFTIHQDRCAMKVTTDGCLFGAWTAAQVKKEAGIRSALDIGAGTGLLSLMVSQECPGLSVDAVELDKPACQQALENVREAGMEKNITLHQADILAFSPGKKYDCIFSNPPFYEKELKGPTSEKNIAHHNEGLLLADLLRCARSLLSQDGKLYLLLPYKREKEIRQLFKEETCFIHQWVTVKPATHLPPFRILLEAGFNKQQAMEFKEDSLAVKEESGAYTSAFAALLKEYYLLF